MTPDSTNITISKIIKRMGDAEARLAAITEAIEKRVDCPPGGGEWGLREFCGMLLKILKEDKP